MKIKMTGTLKVKTVEIDFESPLRSQICKAMVHVRGEIHPWQYFTARPIEFHASFPLAPNDETMFRDFIEREAFKVMEHEDD